MAKIQILSRALGTKKAPAAKRNGTGLMNPYLSARSEYDSRFGDLAKQRNRWQSMSFLLGIVVLGFSLQLIRMAAQSHVEPYVVEVDREGTVRTVGPAAQMQDPSRAMLASELARFVTAIRTVSSDPLTQRQMVGAGFAYADQNTASFLNQYFSDSATNPIVLGRTFARLVDVTSILPVPESQAWRVEWRETTLPISQGSPSVSSWEGYFTLRLSPPRTGEEIVRNPLGLYVTDITWSRMSEPRPVSAAGAQGR